MIIKTFEKIGIVVAVIVIILITVWLIRIGYSAETQRRESEALLKEIKEIATGEEETLKKLPSEQTLEEILYEAIPPGEELPPPAELFQGPGL